jgi:CheY-specific phosphatase CheX
MKAEHINAFIEATLETFQSMCNISFHRSGKVKKVGGEIVEADDLMAICGLTGDIKGAVMLTTPLDTGMKLVSAFLMEEITTVNCDLMDGWGELVNILAGAADAKIDDFKIDLSLPSVVLGKNARFYAKAGNPFVIVPMNIKDVGPFNLGVSMELPKK